MLNTCFKYKLYIYIYVSYFVDLKITVFSLASLKNIYGSTTVPKHP